MDYQQNVSEWLQTCKPVRNMSLGAEMDTDVDVGINKSGASQGQIHLPPASSMSISVANSTKGRSAQPEVAFQFFLAHKALMDPHAFLKLTTRYTSMEILSWANEGIKRSILSEQQLRALTQTAISQVTQHIDSGDEILRNAVEFARQHNRLHCYRMALNRQQQRRKGVTLVSQDIDSWYNCISDVVASDDKIHKQSWSKSFRGSATPFGRILGELLYDPLFTYRSLLEIPDRVLLEFCISHSYEHVSDKISLNNGHCRVRPQEIINRVYSVLHDPAVWDIATTTTQTSTRENALLNIQLRPHTVASPAATRIRTPTVDDYFKRCANCIDVGAKHCATKKVEGKSPCRQPGQQCTKCTTLGVPCTDRLKPTKEAFPVGRPTRAPCNSCAHKGFRCTLDSSSKCCEACSWELSQGNKVLCSFIVDEYRQRQVTGGHERETLKQGTFDDFASKQLRAGVFCFLNCSRDGQFAPTPNDAVRHSNYKEHELRKAITSLSQTASEAQSQMGMSAAAGSSSTCTIVIDSDSDKDTVEASAGPASGRDSDDDEDFKYYDSMCESLVDETMLY
jgi:hypothetical protein